jgi:hypothetical protein
VSTPGEVDLSQVVEQVTAPGGATVVRLTLPPVEPDQGWLSRIRAG